MAPIFSLVGSATVLVAVWRTLQSVRRRVEIDRRLSRSLRTYVSNALAPQESSM